MRKSQAMIHFILTLVVISISTPVLAAQDTRPAKPEPIAAPEIAEDLIAEAPPSSEIVEWRVAGVNSEQHIAWVSKLAGRRTVWLDSTPIGTYEDVKHLAFRGNERQLSFVAARNSKWLLVANGKEFGGDYTKITAADMGRSGAPSAGVCRGKSCRLLLNGAETGPTFEDIGWPEFSPDGEHYAYAGKRNDKWIALVNGQQVGPEMDEWLTIRWIPGSRIAVAAELQGKYTWVVDGRPGPTFDVISRLAVSRDAEHHAFSGASAMQGFAKKDVVGSIVVDGQQVETGFTGKAMLGNWGWIGGRGEFIRKGLRQLSTGFHGVSDPVYTSNGDLVFAHRFEDGRAAVRVGKRDGPMFDDIVSPIVTDAGHVAYVGLKADSFVEVRDETTGAQLPAKRDVAYVSWINMNTDRLAYVAVLGGKNFKSNLSDRALHRLVVDGRAAPEYDARDLDCRLGVEGYACVVVGAEKNRDRIVFNGREGRVYDDIMTGSLTFVSSGLQFLARQERRLLRVTIGPGARTTE